ncbi:MAG: hypothetical protein LAO77_07160 [Acidobacteriia bacterium]|nr:hypothetical protein [Terriglobia bacterium]
MSALEAKIDRLYQLALDEFTAARNTLAKSLTGADAALVKQLVKPTVVPWAVNQVYWRARPVYDRVLESGEKLRKAQIGALEGRAADVRAASDAHRRAIADAVREAEQLMKGTGVGKNPSDSRPLLTRVFEALSLTPTPPEPHGRLTAELQPAGLEALAGITPKEKGDGSRQQSLRLPSPSEAEIKSAEADLARAEASERSARQAWERAHDELLAARKALSELRIKN